MSSKLHNGEVRGGGKLLQLEIELFERVILGCEEWVAAGGGQGGVVSRTA